MKGTTKKENQHVHNDLQTIVFNECILLSYFFVFLDAIKTKIFEEYFSCPIAVHSSCDITCAESRRIKGTYSR